MTRMISQSDLRLLQVHSDIQLTTLLTDIAQTYKSTKQQSSVDILNTWANSYWQENWQLHSFAYYQDDKLICLAPFFIEKSKFFPFIKTLHLVGQGEAEYAEVALEYLDVFIKRGYEKTVYPLIIKEINKLNFDLCVVKAVFKDSHIAKILPHIRGTLTQQHYAQYKVDKVHWQFEQLSKNTRSRINRCKNQLTNLSAIVRWLNDEEYDNAWCLLKKHHQSRWQNKGKNGAFAAPEFNEFHKALREKNSGTIAMSAVFIGEQPIAIHYYLVSNDTYHFYQSGWDQQNYAKLSPGLYLHYWSIINCPTKYYDFMMGGINNSYKAKFNADARAMISITVVKSPVKLFFSKVCNKLNRSLFSRFIRK
ncbi:GNAT family N-acetyltransferase [Cognaticolwellia beringensis]|uniref:GNAT family N-acetyltransferase n=1 Tax=Cognaticolwellia beringensis TaxID=1967665 RepID=A0A222G8P7_9GAMM|nr:GNAT family N-acetyltransferase [Cognaticolwellia beringensis]ASP47983.1 GNAT family N-acetyltransferase [Cognaticolwellia beringensis]